MFEIYLKKYIDAKLNINIQPSFVTDVPGCIYVHSPISVGPVNESQYEVKIIDDDLDRAVQKRDELIKLLNTPAKKTWTTCESMLFRAALSGGGQLFNDSIQVWELSLIFIVKWRIKDGK